MQRSTERQLNRHRNFNYSLPGFYYITICTHRGINWFGRVEAGLVVENCYGQLAHNLWQSIPFHYQNIALDEFIIMPNHIHGIICVQNNVGTEHCSVPTLNIRNEKNYGLISKIIKSFKNAFSTTIRHQYHNYNFHWQRSFYDRVLRDDDELEHARWYIENNPRNWPRDQNNTQI